MSKYLIISLLLIFPCLISAQIIEPNIELEKKAKECYTFMRDEVKAGNYQTALPYLNWLIKNYPTASKQIFQDGAKIYENVAKTTTEEKQRVIYQDSALLMYDLRIKYLGDRAYPLNRKGLIAWEFWQNRPERQRELFELYQKIVELNGNNTYYFNVANFARLICKLKNSGQITDNQVDIIFISLTQIIDANLKKEKNEQYENWQKTQVFLQEIEINCLKKNKN